MITTHLAAARIASVGSIAALCLIGAGYACAQHHEGGAPLQTSAICATDGNAQLLCGQSRPEDLLQVPNTNWIVVSWLGGGLRLIDTRDKSTRALYPSPSTGEKLDKTTYGACPGAPSAQDKAEMVTVGVGMRPAKDGKHFIYAVRFAGMARSVEVLELDVRGSIPSATWIGCVIAPKGVGLNSVAPLPGGGFIASNWLAPGPDSQAVRERMMAGEINGELWEWQPSAGWSKLPGSEAAGANGVEVSKDGKWIYAAAWGSRKLFRVSRGASPPKRDEVSLDFRPDNLHWGPDGKIIVAGHAETATRVVKIDPDTLAVTPLIDKPDTKAFEHGTGAIQVGDAIWVGSSRSERIAIFPVPK